MANAPTHAELVEIARDEMAAGNSLLDPDVIDVEGHPANILVNVAAALGHEVGRQLTLAERQLQLDSAAGEDLDRLVWNNWGVYRHGAAPSVGSVQITRPSAAYGAITIASGTVLLAEDGTRFELTEDAVFSGAALGPVTADIRSVLAGAGQAASEDTITAFETTPLDSSLLVTNAEDTAGDADAETDPEFRERVRFLFLNSRRGTLKALEYGAKTVAGVRFAVATEVTTPGGIPFRKARLQVADRNGQSNVALVAAVTSALEEWRAAGIYVQVLGGTVTFVDIGIALEVDSEYDSGLVADAVRVAVVAALNQLAPGETLYHSTIIAACKAVPGVVDATVTDPVAALVPDEDETLRTRSELIDISSP